MIDFGIYQNGRRLFSNVLPSAVEWSKSRRGPEAASCVLPVPLERAARWVGAGGLSEVRIATRYGLDIWRGRIEDIGAATGGTTITALGYRRAFSDVPYTALWSHAGSAGYREVTVEELASTTNERYETDNNNRLYMAIRKGNETSTSSRARLVYNLPDRGDRAATSVTYTYNIAGCPSYPFDLVVAGYDRDWTLTNSTTHTVANSTPVSATNTHTFTGDTVRVVFSWSHNTSTEYNYACGETGEAGRAIITGLQIRALGTGDILASDVAAGLLEYVTDFAGTGVGSSDALIEATTAHLTNERYEDTLPSEILSDLAGSVNDWGVDEYRQFYYQPRRTRRTWQVQASDIRLPYSLDAVTNSAYTVFGDGAGETLRTEASDSQYLIDAFGVTRRRSVSDRTTSAATATEIRDNFLRDREADAVLADIVAGRIISPGGRMAKLWEIEPGDSIRVVNAPAYSQFVTAAFEFSIARASYNLAQNRLSVEPDEPTRTLVNLLARQTGGLTPR